MTKRMFSFLIALVLLCAMSMSVSAHEVPNLEELGSITFIVDYENEPVDGGSLTLYRVGDIVENNGDYSFALIEKLDDEKTALDNLEDPQLARDLAVKVAEAELKGITEPVKEGEAVFAEVEPGLYVVVQNEAAEGFEKMSPFVISMPKFENGTYVTDIKAEPKPSLEKAPEKPEKPQDPTLPQTGQLNWPVPVLAVGGVMLFALGWVICFKKRKES